MNKLVIPSLLLGVVMIAGAFAFIPVQEASTVHTSGTVLLGTNGIPVDGFATSSIQVGDFAAGAINESALAANAATKIKDAVALIDTTSVYTFGIATADLASTAINLQSANNYVGTVTLVAGPAGSADAAACTGDVLVTRDTTGDGSSNDTILTVSPANAPATGTATFDATTDQLFISTAAMGTGDSCMATVIIHLTSSVT